MSRRSKAQRKNNNKGSVPKIPLKRAEPGTQAALAAEVAAQVAKELEKLGAGVSGTVNVGKIIINMGGGTPDKPKGLLKRLFGKYAAAAPTAAVFLLTMGGVFLNSATPAEASLDAAGREVANVVVEEVVKGAVKGRFGEVAGSIASRGVRIVNETAAERAEARARLAAPAEAADEAGDRQEAAKKRVSAPGASGPG